MYEHDSLYTKKKKQRYHNDYENNYDNNGKGCAAYSLIGLIIIITLTFKAIF